MQGLLRLLLVGSIAVAALRGGASAQPASPAPTPDKAKAKVAKQYVDAGLAAQNSGDYDTAITFYTKAYQLVRHPVLVFNMAQAHRLAGRTEEALRLYARYLEEDPQGPQAQTARELVAEIEARKADAARKVEDARKAEDARMAEAARLADAARKAEDDRKLAEARKAEAVRAAEPPPAALEAPAPAPAPGRGLRIAGIATGAAGGVALAVGIGFGLKARSLSSELSKPGALYSADKFNQGESANTLAVTGLVGGSILVAAGAALYWWGHVESNRGERLSFAPIIAEGFAGVVACGALP